MSPVKRPEFDMPVTGDPTIDLQHLELADLLVKLESLSSDAGNARVIFDACSIISNYLHDHFWMEERMMIDIRFDRIEFELHVAAHAIIRRSGEEIIRQYRTGPAFSIAPLKSWFNGWINDHVPNHDQLLANAARLTRPPPVDGGVVRSHPVSRHVF